MKRAYVICLNDDVKFVVLDDEIKAREEKEERAKAYYEDNKCCWRSYKEYCSLCLWNIREVGYEG